MTAPLVRTVEPVNRYLSPHKGRDFYTPRGYARIHGGNFVVLAVVLAFGFGYALTMRGVLRAGVGFGDALKIALAADTVSIAVMEIVDNAMVLAVPGAMEAGLSKPLFWVSLAFALAVAFVLTVPVNRWMISRGRGHAVVHQHHH